MTSTAPTRADVCAAAAELHSRGFALCKPDPREKKPTYKGWSARSLEPTDFVEGDQIGILGGPLSSGGKPGHALVMIDLDAPAAVAQADGHLPPTGMSEGRASKPGSHRYYLVPNDSIPRWACSTADQGAKAAEEQAGHPGPFLKHFAHRESKTGVLDFIGTGGQVVCPPAAHPSGERREWTGGAPGEPAVVRFLELWQKVCELASECGAQIPDVMPRPQGPRPAMQPTDVVTRASKYLAKCSPSVSKQKGHSAAFWAARCMVYGFDLDPRTALGLLADQFNPGCAPPWSPRELEHKIEDADRIPFDKPRGWLRDESGRTRNGVPITGAVAANGNGKHLGGGASVESPADPPAVARPTDELIVTRVSNLKARPVRYLVPGRIPRGKTILWAGRGGTGKSTAARAMAAHISTGRCALGMTYPDPVRGKVLVVAAEDGPEDTILPGLLAEGADVERVELLEGVKHENKKIPFTLLPEHVALVKARLLADREIRLVIIDPVASFVGRTRIDDHRATELRLVLDPLSELAEECDATFLLIAHLNKATGAAVDRIAGSAAYRDAVRAAYIVTEDPDDDTRRLLTPIKQNLAGFDGTAVPFSLAELTDEEAAAVVSRPQFADLSAEDCNIVRRQLRRVQFDAPVKANPDFATSAKKNDPNKIERCVQFIRSFLAEYAYPSEELLAAAKAARFTFDNVAEARLRLKADGLRATNLGVFQGKWWTGFGSPEAWNVRPLASCTTNSKDSTHSKDSKDSKH